MSVFGNTAIDVTLKYFFDASDELLLNAMAFAYQLDLTMGRYSSDQAVSQLDSVHTFSCKLLQCVW